MAEAPRSTPVRTDWPKESRVCGGGGGGNPLLAKCASTAMNIAGLGAPSLPNGWKRDVGDDGASVLVLPPADHPFWRGYDVARQTGAMFQTLGAEKDALAAELATTLVRRPALRAMLRRCFLEMGETQRAWRGSFIGFPVLVSGVCCDALVGGATQEAKASMSSAIEWLQNSNRKLKERVEREQARSNNIQQQAALRGNNAPPPLVQQH